MNGWIWLAAVAALAMVASSSAHADGDAGRGEDVFRWCTPCHQVGVGARNGVGPVLNNVVGRRAASRDGYSYSRALREAGANGLIWNATTLDGYIADPRGYVRGNRMAFAGIRDDQVRQDLIAYMRTLSFDDPAQSKILK